MLKIKELRLEMGLTQKKIAEKINTNPQNISRWENGESDPASSFLIKLADFFNCSIDFLAGREDDFGIKSYEERTVGSFSPRELELVSLFRQLPEVRQINILDNTRFMVDSSAKHKA